MPRQVYETTYLSTTTSSSVVTSRWTCELDFVQLSTCTFPVATAHASVRLDCGLPGLERPLKYSTLKHRTHIWSVRSTLAAPIDGGDPVSRARQQRRVNLSLGTAGSVLERSVRKHSHLWPALQRCVLKRWSEKSPAGWVISAAARAEISRNLVEIRAQQARKKGKD